MSVFPPALLANEQLALKRSTWKAAYHAARDEEALASVEVRSRDYLSFENELREKRLRFENAMGCINAAGLAKRMELAAKMHGIPRAGRYKPLVARLRKQTREFTEQKPASEAATLADSRRRKEEATAPRRADTNQGCEGGGGVDEGAASSALSAAAHTSARERQQKHHRPISTRTGQSVTLRLPNGALKLRGSSSKRR